MANRVARAINQSWIGTNGWTDDPANGKLIGIKIDGDGKVLEFESFHVFYFMNG